jgi:hypothetical protein
MPFCMALLEKISAKLGAIIHLMPKSFLKRCNIRILAVKQERCCSQTPWSMFTRAPAPEVVTGAHHNLGIVKRYAVENKVGVLTRMRILAKSIEESIREASPFQSFQKLFRNDHVCVDIFHM